MDNRDLVYELSNYHHENSGGATLKLISDVQLNNLFITEENNNTVDYIGAPCDIHRSQTFDRIMRKNHQYMA